MEDVRALKELQLDALREVANIGAGHAATALSQMTNRTIMIAVPEVNVRAARGRHRHGGPPRRASMAAVLMHMMGDLTGRTLVLFPEGSARTLCDILFRRSAGTTGEFGAMEQSGLKEAGNILASAYMNALSDFMGMMLVPSVPSLVIDLNAAVLTTTYLNFGHDRDFVFCVETSFRVEGAIEPLRGHFLLLPDTPSLRAIFDAIRLHLSRCPAPVLSERDLAVLRSFAGRIDPSDAGAHNNLGVLYHQKGLIEEAIAEFVPRARAGSADAGGPETTSRSPTARAGTTIGGSPICASAFGGTRRTGRRGGSSDRAYAALGRHVETPSPSFEALLAWQPPSDVPAVLRLQAGGEGSRRPGVRRPDSLARAWAEVPPAPSHPSSDRQDSLQSAA